MDKDRHNRKFRRDRFLFWMIPVLTIILLVTL